MDLHNLYIMAIPAFVALAGGFLAVIWSPKDQTRSLIQHFAAGVVLAALAVELLPEIEKEHASALVTLASFAVGCLFMYGLKLWTLKLEHASKASSESSNTGLILATFIDVAMDGFIIGAGFAAGGNVGMILALGLSVELLFLGLSISSPSVSNKKMVTLSGMLGLTVMICAIMGNYILSGASHALIGGVLSFSAAALLYLVTDELLIEAHEVEEKPISTLVMFSGFLIFWAIQLMGSA